MKKVVLNEGLETIDEFAFAYCSITEIDVPKTVVCYTQQKHCHQLM